MCILFFNVKLLHCSWNVILTYNGTRIKLTLTDVTMLTSRHTLMDFNKLYWLAGTFTVIIHAQGIQSQHLIGQAGVCWLLLRREFGPQLSQDAGHTAVVQMRVPLPYQAAVSLAEDEESIHWSPHPQFAGWALGLLIHLYTTFHVICSCKAKNSTIYTGTSSQQEPNQIGLQNWHNSLNCKDEYGIITTDSLFGVIFFYKIALWVHCLWETISPPGAPRRRPVSGLADFHVSTACSAWKSLLCCIPP